MAIVSGAILGKLALLLAGGMTAGTLVGRRFRGKKAKRAAKSKSLMEMYAEKLQRARSDKSALGKRQDLLDNLSELRKVDLDEREYEVKKRGMSTEQSADQEYLNMLLSAISQGDDPAKQAMNQGASGIMGSLSMYLQ